MRRLAAVQQQDCVSWAASPHLRRVQIGHMRSPARKVDLKDLKVLISVLESAIEACCGSCVLCYANLVLLHSNVCAERHPE